jgi:fucose permease
LESAAASVEKPYKDKVRYARRSRGPFLLQIKEEHMNTATLNKKSMWILLIGSGLSTFGIFVAVPLIALHAFQVFKLSAYEIGLLSGIWPATVFSFSFLCGMAADKWGYLLAIRFSLLINTMAFIILSISQSVEFFVLGLFLFGVGKTFFDSSIRAAMTCVCPPQSREKYFRLRYLIQNTGCVIGPIVGTFAYGHIGGKAFVLTSLSYFITAVSLISE